MFESTLILLAAHSFGSSLLSASCLGLGSRAAARPDGGSCAVGRAGTPRVPVMSALVAPWPHAHLLTGHSAEDLPQTDGFCYRGHLYVSCVGNWGPHLVVVRGCNILKWELELKRWCPGLKTLLYVGSHRELKAKRQVC